VRAVQQLASSHGLECVAFDYRGHGQSSGEFLALGIRDWLADTRAVLGRVVNAESVVVVGSSLGGWVACLLALEQQAQQGQQMTGGEEEEQQQSHQRTPHIKALVLVNPAVDASETLWEGLSESERQEAVCSGRVPLGSPYLQGSEDNCVGMAVVEQGRELLLLQAAGAGGRGDAAVSGHTQSDDSALAGSSAAAATAPPALGCPVTILHGEADTVVPRRCAWSRGWQGCQVAGRVRWGWGERTTQEDVSVRHRARAC
jgi:pimeloyl-ACP methyl ester carboxylesterase